MACSGGRTFCAEDDERTWSFIGAHTPAGRPQRLTGGRPRLTPRDRLGRIKVLAYINLLAPRRVPARDEACGLRLRGGHTGDLFISYDGCFS